MKDWLSLAKSLALAVTGLFYSMILLAVWIGYGLGKEGNYTGTMPTNQTERNLWELQGHRVKKVFHITYH